MVVFVVTGNHNDLSGLRYLFNQLFVTIAGVNIPSENNKVFADGSIGVVVPLHVKVRQ
jgi:hypothetical protein